MKNTLIIISLAIVFVLAAVSLASSFENSTETELTPISVNSNVIEVAEDKSIKSNLADAVEEKTTLETAPKVTEVAAEPKETETTTLGKASYYADKYHGRMTANGEIFDKRAMTAAHKTLPFNTVVRVTNLDNGKSVVVRINDRGPFIKGRIIDLSEKAAEDIAMVNKGVVDVKMEIVEGR